jgi:hypothetical protein
MRRDSALDVAVAVAILEVLFILMTGGVALFVIPWPVWLIVPIAVFFLVSYWEEDETKSDTDVRK